MQRMQEQWHFDWFMYDCPAQQLSKVGRQCRELQEAAVSKAATFFAAENMLPQAHGSTQVGGQVLYVACIAPLWQVVGMDTLVLT